MKNIKIALNNLAESLSPFDSGSANYIRKLKNKTPEEIANDNNIWGGAGSLLDNGISNSTPGAEAMFMENALNLGKALLAEGCENPRLKNWVSTYEQWQNNNA